MKRSIIAAAMLLGGISSAQASDVEMYAGIGAGMVGIEYSQPGLNINQNVPAVMLKFGVNFNEFFGVETRLAGTADGDTPVGASKVELGTGFVSILAKVQYPVSSDFSVYVLGGGTSATLSRKQTTTAGAVLIDDKATEFGGSYGLGMEFKIKDNMSVSGDWMQYWSSVNVGPGISTTLWGATATFNYYF